MEDTTPPLSTGDGFVPPPAVTIDNPTVSQQESISSKSWTTVRALKYSAIVSAAMVVVGALVYAITALLMAPCVDTGVDYCLAQSSFGSFFALVVFINSLSVVVVIIGVALGIITLLVGVSYWAIAKFDEPSDTIASPKRYGALMVAILFLYLIEYGTSYVIGHFVLADAAGASYSEASWRARILAVDTLFAAYILYLGFARGLIKTGEGKISKKFVAVVILMMIVWCAAAFQYFEAKNESLYTMDPIYIGSPSYIDFLF